MEALPHLSPPAAAIPPYKLYTPKAVGLATFLGSPMAGAVLIALNYLRLKRKRAAWQTIGLGILGTAALFTIAFLIPDGISRSLQLAPAIGSIFVMKAIAESLQGRYLNHHARHDGKTASLWAAAGIGLAGLLITVGVIVAIVVLNSPNLGTKINISASEEIYYSKQATQSDAEKLGQVLKAMGFFNGKGAKSVLLERTSTGTRVKFVVSEGTWDRDEAISVFQNIGRQVGNSGLGRPVTIVLCDESLTEKREINAK